MVIDSSAIFAIVQNEPERELFLNRIIGAEAVAMSAATLLECRIVALRKVGDDLDNRLSALLQRFPLSIIPFDESQAILASAAYRMFGRGQHRAGLNFGDCVSYALAKSRGETLLYKGRDFTRTDIVSALA